MKKPNILLLMCDQFRGDCLSFANHPDVKTPYLDTLADDGIFFKNGYSACPSCIPARAALLSGRSQKLHGRVGYQEGINWNYDHMLAEELSKGGYYTQCVGKMHVHPPRFLCGFQGLKLHDGYIGHYRKANTPYYQHQNVSDDYMRFLKDKLGNFADVNGSGVENNSWITHPWPYEERYHPTNWVVDESIQFLEMRDRTKPFFLMASFVRPHPPFDAPKSYFDMYYGKKLREPAQGDWVDHHLCEQHGKTMDSIHGCNDEELRHQAMAGYYACITHIDHQIGRLITALENDETYNDTIILFTADHGELLFDNECFRKVLPYQGSINIPMIMHIGKNIRKVTPYKSDTIVELRDIMPTLLELAGLDIPETVDGLSLKQEIFNEPKNEREYLHGEHAGGNQSNHAIITKEDKYIWFSQTGVEQYFNLINDPREEHNLINDESVRERIALLKKYLIDELKEREENYTDGTNLLKGTPKACLDFLLKQA